MFATSQKCCDLINDHGISIFSPLDQKMLTNLIMIKVCCLRIEPSQEERISFPYVYYKYSLAMHFLHE